MSHGTERRCPGAAQAYAVPLINDTNSYQQQVAALENHMKEKKSTVLSKGDCLDQFKNPFWDNTSPEPSCNSDESNCHDLEDQDKAWWEVEVCKPILVKTPILLRSPTESKSFRDAVVEKSSRITGLGVENHSEGQTPATNYTMTVRTVSPVRLQKAERYVWVNSTSAHSQNVAKAKYEFLFGESKTAEEKARETDDPGSTRLLQQTASITNEFPEYGTTEHRENDTFRNAYGFLGEPTQCVEEIKELEQLYLQDPMIQNESLEGRSSEPCAKEEQKTSTSYLQNGGADNECSSKILVTSVEVNSETQQDGNCTSLCPAIHVEIKLDNTNSNSGQDEQVVPSPENSPVAPVVHAERKSYLYVERELAAISEEETLSESSLSQITEIADYPKSQHSTVSVQSTAILDHKNKMEENSNASPVVRKTGGDEDCGDFHVERPEASTENAAINNKEASTVRTDMSEPWEGTIASRLDEGHKEKASLA
ncbi:uncharacterized protein O3C94_022634 [Discoglossus pictus]